MLSLPHTLIMAGHVRRRVVTLIVLPALHFKLTFYPLILLVYVIFEIVSAFIQYFLVVYYVQSIFGLLVVGEILSRLLIGWVR